MGCVAGALEESAYREATRASAGFEEIDIDPWRVYNVSDAREFLSGTGIDVDAMAPVANDKFASAFIRARKPVIQQLTEPITQPAAQSAAKTCCGPECCAF